MSRVLVTGDSGFPGSHVCGLDREPRMPVDHGLHHTIAYFRQLLDA